MDKIIIIGGGGHAKVLIAMLRKLGTYEISGYVDSVDNGPVADVAWLGTDTKLDDLFDNAASKAVLGIGHPSDAATRKKVYNMAVSLGFSFPVITAADVVVSEDVGLEAGSVVMSGAVIQPGSKAGLCAIINTNTTVDHDCVLGDFVHIASGAVLCGGVQCGSECLIGAGAVVLPGVKIASHCIIGAGAVVIRDCVGSGVYAGNPARRIS